MHALVNDGRHVQSDAAPLATEHATLFRVEGLSKRFGAVQALNNMSFSLNRGEVHVLFGENGAGKSTLINMIAGALQPDHGQMWLDGQPLVLRDVQDARRHGIAAMFQEFSLAPTLSVEENILLGAEPRRGIFIDLMERRRRVRAALSCFGFDLDLKVPVSRLSRAQQQMVEMAKALLTEPKLLILDEPTASLSEKETEALFELVESLREQGVSIIYITHRIKEIYRISDRITVMRDGQFISTVETAAVTEEQLVQLMTGRTFEAFYPEIVNNPGACLLSLQGVSSTDGSVREVDLQVHAGEVVGLAGLVGCGKSEIGRAVFGLVPISDGQVQVEGKPSISPSPRSMLDRGLVYITSDRRNEGLMLLRPTQENITLPALHLKGLSRAGCWLRTSSERRTAKELGERMRVRPLALDGHLGRYSGGNQQKVLIAKALSRDTRVFIFDEPTVGIDVSARVEVYACIKALAEAGNAVVVISSDLPEVLNLSHRLYVVRDGRIVDHMEKAEITESRALHGFFGTQCSAHLESSHD
ncbi:ribose transport system ATP-binding protein [Pseudomonas laurylsulfatiphila]|uniref:sugar ABC transporter ATP-binding protein n=1 Tax=Pseudomonas laurylsulfatiphila TaxID=2011015 RepID=UPI003D1E043D